MAVEAWGTRCTLILTGASRGIEHASVKRFSTLGGVLSPVHGSHFRRCVRGKRGRGITS
jgi:hypothetical protein